MSTLQLMSAACWLKHKHQCSQQLDKTDRETDRQPNRQMEQILTWQVLECSPQLQWQAHAAACLSWCATHSAVLVSTTITTSTSCCLGWLSHQQAHQDSRCVFPYRESHPNMRKLTQGTALGQMLPSTASNHG